MSAVRGDRKLCGRKSSPKSLEANPEFLQDIEAASVLHSEQSEYQIGVARAVAAHGLSFRHGELQSRAHIRSEWAFLAWDWGADPGRAALLSEAEQNSI